MSGRFFSRIQKGRIFEEPIKIISNNLLRKTTGLLLASQNICWEARNEVTLKDNDNDKTQSTAYADTVHS